MTLKEVIEELEKRNGNSICAVADKYGVSYQTLANWKKGQPKTDQVIDFYNQATKDLEEE